MEENNSVQKKINRNIWWCKYLYRIKKQN